MKCQNKQNHLKLFQILQRIWQRSQRVLVEGQRLEVGQAAHLRGETRDFVAVQVQLTQVRTVPDCLRYHRDGRFAQIQPLNILVPTSLQFFGHVYVRLDGLSLFRSRLWFIRLRVFHSDHLGTHHGHFRTIVGASSPAATSAKRAVHSFCYWTTSAVICEARVVWVVAMRRCEKRYSCCGSYYCVCFSPSVW